MRPFSLIARSLLYISLVFSALNLSTNEAVAHHEIVGAPSRNHQYSNASSIHVNHRQHSGFDTCLGRPHSNTRNELKVHLHAQYLAVVLGSCVPVALPSGVNTEFAPRSSKQVSQVVVDRLVPSVERQLSPLSVQPRHPVLLQV